MKVGLLLGNELKFSPYVDSYTDILKQNNIDYEVVEFNRKKNLFDMGENPVIGCKMSNNKYLKVLPYLKWRAAVKKLVKKKKYDRLIVFTSMSAVLINKFLLKNYKNKYIFDIRDYAYESISFYKKIVDRLIDNSFCTTISSKGFLRFLSESDKIVVNHNMPLWFSKYHKKEISTEFAKPINIGYLGMISYYDKNVRICEQIKNDEDFTAQYYGTLAKINIVDYCKENGITNVHYHGPYNNRDKFEIYKNIDFINAVYGNERMLVTSALPNKLYDCIICKKPIIVSDKTYLSELVEEYGLGISLSGTDNIKDRINEYLKSFDKDKFNEGCNSLYELVVKENSECVKKIEEFIK